jgi:hypothetical protein
MQIVQSQYSECWSYLQRIRSYDSSEYRRLVRGLADAQLRALEPDSIVSLLRLRYPECCAALERMREDSPEEQIKVLRKWRAIQDEIRNESNQIDLG